MAAVLPKSATAKAVASTEKRFPVLKKGRHLLNTFRDMAVNAAASAVLKRTFPLKMRKSTGVSQLEKRVLLQKDMPLGVGLALHRGAEMTPQKYWDATGGVEGTREGDSYLARTGWPTEDPGGHHSILGTNPLLPIGSSKPTVEINLDHPLWAEYESKVGESSIHREFLEETIPEEIVHTAQLYPNLWRGQDLKPKELEALGNIRVLREWIQSSISDPQSPIWGRDIHEFDPFELHAEATARKIIQDQLPTKGSHIEYDFYNRLATETQRARNKLKAEGLL